MGTVFYKITKRHLQKLLHDTNLILEKTFKMYEWASLNLDDYLWGSRVIDDCLYICETDGQEVEIGNEVYDPEELLDYFTVEQLEDDFIEEASDDYVKRHVTAIEMDVDLDSVAEELIAREGVPFTMVVESAKDVKLI